MLSVVLSKLHTLSYITITKYNDFTTLFIYIRRNALKPFPLKPFQSLTLDLQQNHSSHLRTSGTGSGTLV